MFYWLESRSRCLESHSTPPRSCRRRPAGIEPSLAGIVPAPSGFPRRLEPPPPPPIASSKVTAFQSFLLRCCFVVLVHAWLLASAGRACCCASLLGLRACFLPTPLPYPISVSLIFSPRSRHRRTDPACEHRPVPLRAPVLRLSPSPFCLRLLHPHQSVSHHPFPFTLSAITRLARPYCLTPGSPAPPTPPLQVQLQIQHLLSSYKKGGHGEVGTGEIGRAHV